MKWLFVAIVLGICASQTSGLWGHGYGSRFFSWVNGGQTRARDGFQHAPPKEPETPSEPTKTQKQPQGAIYCYWGTWANNRPGIGGFGVDDIPTDLCTHIIVTFAFVTAEGEITYPEETTVDGNSNAIADALLLKEKNSDLKFHISIGGWSAGSTNFSTVANNDTLRATFVENAYNFVLDNDLDGLDIDWEYPAARGGIESDKEAFIWLLRDLHAVLNPAGLALSIAVGISESYIETSYNVAAIMDYVNHVVLMTYDYHGTWETVTGVNSPLYPQLTDESSAINANASVNLWLNNGATASKLLLGIGSYGKSFTLTSLDDVGTGANVTGGGTAGDYTQETGVLAYYEICLAQKLTSGWVITEVVGNYAYANSGLQWVGYDNVNTMKAKGAYAKAKGLGGVSMWAIDLDDFSGQCSEETYPLLTAAVEGYNDS